MEEKPSGDTSPATTRVRANPGTATLNVEGEVFDNVSICQRAYEPVANVYAIALPHLIEYLLFGYDSIRVDGAAVGEDEVRQERWRVIHRILLMVLKVFVGRLPTQIDIDFDVEGVVCEKAIGSAPALHLHV
eukprot:scaffold11894_cov267-Chaetoceros_neogracile.AAC.1